MNRIPDDRDERVSIDLNELRVERRYPTHPSHNLVHWQAVLQWTRTSVDTILSQMPAPRIRATANCRHMLRIWNSHPFLSRAGLGDSLSEDVVRSMAIAMFGLAKTLQDVLTAHDRPSITTGLPIQQYASVWPTIWDWIDPLIASSQSIISKPLAFQRYDMQHHHGVVTDTLHAFTSCDRKLTRLVTETPGYISTISQLWVEESDISLPKLGLLSSLLFLPFFEWMQDPNEAQGIRVFRDVPIELVQAAGGKLQVVSRCINRMAGCLVSEMPDQRMIWADMQILKQAAFSTDECFHTAMKKSPKLAPVLIDALDYMTKVRLDDPGGLIRLGIMQDFLGGLIVAFGEIRQVERALQKDVLIVIARVASTCPALTRGIQLLDDQLTIFLLYPFVLSSAQEALGRLDRQMTLLADPFKDDLLRYKQRVTSWSTAEAEIKASRSSYLMCGDPEVRE